MRGSGSAPAACTARRCSSGRRTLPRSKSCNAPVTGLPRPRSWPVPRSGWSTPEQPRSRCAPTRCTGWPRSSAAGEGWTRVGLLGTAFTMDRPMYPDAMAAHGIEVLTPPAEDRGLVHRVIYDELCQGVIRGGSRQAYRRIIRDLVARGAQAVVLGCTEISMLVGPADAEVPLPDTTALHAAAIVDFALQHSLTGAGR